MEERNFFGALFHSGKWIQILCLGYYMKVILRKIKTKNPPYGGFFVGV